MPVDEIKPTRSGLLIVRRRMALAERIHRLLKMKLDGMMLELVRLTDQAARERKELEEKYAHAREMAAVATMMEGATGVLLAALSVEAVPTYTTGHKNVFGVHLPDLEPVMVKKTLIQRGYGILGTSGPRDLIGHRRCRRRLRGPHLRDHRERRTRRRDYAAARRYRTDQAARERAGVQGHPGAHRPAPVNRVPARRDGAAGCGAAPANQKDKGKETVVKHFILSCGS